MVLFSVSCSLDRFHITLACDHINSKTARSDWEAILVTTNHPLHDNLFVRHSYFSTRPQIRCIRPRPYKRQLRWPVSFKAQVLFSPLGFTEDLRNIFGYDAVIFSVSTLLTVLQSYF